MPTALDAALVTDALGRLDGWSGDTEQIRRTLHLDAAQFADFTERVKVTADAMDHHPDVTRDGDEVAIVLTTHDTGAVTEYDIAMASRINDLARQVLGQPQPPLPPEAFGHRAQRKVLGGRAAARRASAAEDDRDGQVPQDTAPQVSTAIVGPEHERPPRA